MATAKKAPAKPAATAVAVKQSSGAIVDIKAHMAAQLAQLSERTAPASGDGIQITQDKQFKLPDGTKSPGPIQLVIVDFVAANNFYKGAYDPNNISPPACFAIGTNPTKMVPSDNSPEKQAPTCNECPMNEFGSAGNGKACKNQRVLAVLPADADADTPMMVLKTSPTALKSFDGYVRSVATSFGLMPSGVITEVSFDPSQTYATLRFGNPEPNPNVGLAVQRYDEARQRLLVEPDVSQYVDPSKKAAPARKQVGRR